MGIRTCSILRETSTDRIPSRRRRQQIPETRQPLPPTSPEPLAKIICLDPHPAVHYPPTLGSLRVPTGPLVLPSRGNATYGGPAQNTIKSSLATGRNGMQNGPLQGGTTATAVLRRKTPNVSWNSSVFPPRNRIIFLREVDTEY